MFPQDIDKSQKIFSISDCANILSQHKDSGQRIVLCHGVFDLLHIGHIRYLQKAKDLGDMLAVTLTPDRYVNKGPHRPVFTETLRAEAIAALDCVDFVAINEWPTAVGTIQLFKPDIYAKGAEYRDKRTPEIESEEVAIKSVGGQISYIQDVTSSSSQLINKHLSPFPKEVKDYLTDLANKYTTEEILDYIDDFHFLKVLVVGETIIDEYYYCENIGKSSEAPLVVMKYNSHERFAGGAATIANHLSNFCDQVTLLSMVGENDKEASWIKTQLRSNVDPIFITKSNSPTIVKRRYRESYYELPVFEVYILDDSPLTRNDSDSLCSHLSEMLSQYDLVLVADYGHSMLTSESINLLMEKSQFLAVNTQANAGNRGYHTISRYKKADYINLATEELWLEFRQRSDDFEGMLESLARRLNVQQAIITRGKMGAIGFCQETGFSITPSLSTNVLDRSGAGEAFLSITSLCAVKKLPMEILAFLGNVAGAQSVAIVGNQMPLDKLSFSRHLESLLK